MTNHQLVRFDPSALNRALVGFDTLFNDFENRFANQINNNYPPYNVIKFSDDEYRIEIAVTGFDTEAISVELDQNVLIIRGEHAERETTAGEYLHRGLANRNFTRSFTLAEHMEVGDITMRNGVLTVCIRRVLPETLKPRRLKIKAE